MIAFPPSVAGQFADRAYPAALGFPTGVFPLSGGAADFPRLRQAPGFVTIIPDLTALIVSAIVVCLTLVLKRQFFEPLARAMEAREKQVEGAREVREQAQADVAAAEARVADAVAAVRAEGYREMDRIRREAGERAEATLTAARDQAVATLAAGKDSLREQSARAASELDQAAESLASDLTARVLRRAS